jgi:thiopurine S-methyltransferase
MTELNQNYWNNRYLCNDFSWDIGDISLPLKTYFEQLTNKELKILIPGAGNAHEAEFLFKNDFKNVFVLDFANEPLQNFKRRLPDFPQEQIIKQDFFEHHGKYDLIIEQTFFCAINPNLRTLYIKQMKQLLNPNGKLVGLLFDDALNLEKPPFGGNLVEYTALFSTSFSIKKMERSNNSIQPRENRELFFICENSEQSNIEPK